MENQRLSFLAQVILFVLYLTGRVQRATCKFISWPLEGENGPNAKSLQPSPRIVGGKEAQPYEFPSMAQIRVGPQKNLRCGGVIIAPQWVLTAAHCLQGSDPPFYHITVGKHSARVEEPYQQDRQVLRKIQHPRFSYLYQYEFDIGLVKVDQPFEFNSIVQPATLPARKKYRANGILVAAGWGYTCDPSAGVLCRTSPVLKKVSLEFVRDDVCAERLGPPQYDHRVPKSVICAGGNPEGGEDGCDGDSGGPLYKIKDGVQMVAGVTSWGDGCGKPRLPGVWTEVAYYLEWINKTMQSYPD